ncbi:MAG: helix-turn-helix domain-containing protein [Vibrio sp.]
MYLVRSGAASNFESLTLELGVNPIQLMHQVGLRQAEFRDPNTYISYAKLIELLELASIKTKQPLFGLLLAQTQTQEVLGDVPILVSRMKTIEMALQKANEYLYLHAHGAQVKIRDKGEYVQLRISIDIETSTELNTIIQLSVYHLALFIAGLLNVKIDSIPLYLTQIKPELEPAKALKNTVFFHSEFNGIQLKTSQLSHPNHHNEAALDQLLSHRLQNLQQQYPEELADQVKDLIRHLLPTGECCIERIANALGMHHRSLQIQLKEKGYNYRSLLQQTRQEIAKYQLSHGKKSITELALQLGYVEIAVFSRHFKQWTGMSPREWLKESDKNQSKK